MLALAVQRCKGCMRAYCKGFDYKGFGAWLHKVASQKEPVELLHKVVAQHTGLEGVPLGTVQHIGLVVLSHRAV